LYELQENICWKEYPSSDKRKDIVSDKNPGVDFDVETRIEVNVKNPEIILLEDQHKANSNCLVLDVAAEMRMVLTGDNSKMYLWLKDLTVYSSNFAELKDPHNSGSKIKYRVLQPAKIDVIMISDKEQQKVDVRVSDIIVSIAPAAVRTLIGVTSSLGTLETSVKEEKEKEKINSKSLFEPKAFKDSQFWFAKEERGKIDTNTDVLEAVTGTPSEKKEVMVEEKKNFGKTRKTRDRKNIKSTTYTYLRYN